MLSQDVCSQFKMLQRVLSLARGGGMIIITPVLRQLHLHYQSVS